MKWDHASSKKGNDRQSPRHWPKSEKIKFNKYSHREATKIEKGFGFFDIKLLLLQEIANPPKKY